MKLSLFIVLIAVGSLTSCLEKTTKASSETTSGNVDFDTFIASPGTINIVDFSATWCGPCQQLKPVLHQIAQEYSSKVKLQMIDVDQQKELAGQLGVSGIPDVRFFVNGKQVEKFMGAAPKNEIKQMISKILAEHSKQLAAGANASMNDENPTPSPSSTSNPTAPAQQTIQPSKGNQLPPGMSKG